MEQLEPGLTEALAQAYQRAAARDPLIAPHAEAAFEVEGTLGEGGMGTVYAVRDRRIDRRAALKVAREGGPEVEREELDRRFEREARIMARLDHPSIPPVYEFGRSPSGQLYLLMRLIEGRTLAERLEAIEDAPDRDAARQPLLQALVKVSQAVAYAHSQRIIHRDLKPSNIMVGRFGEVLVMDWGIARDERESASEDASKVLSQVTGGDLTQAGAMLGTPGYMAPEQARAEDIDARADVFALGALLTEVLTGRCPTPGETSLARAVAASEGRVLLPRQLDPRAPRDLSELAALALAPDRELRWPDAEGFAAELEGWLGGGELSCVRYSLGERIARRVRRRPLASLGATLLLAFAALSWALYEEVTRVEAERVKTVEDLAVAEEEGEVERRRAEQEAALREALEKLAAARGFASSGAPAESVIPLLSAAIRIVEGRPELAEVTPEAAAIALEGGFVEQARRILDDRLAQAPGDTAALFELHRIELVERDEGDVAMTPALRRMLAAQAGTSGHPESQALRYARALAAFWDARPEAVPALLGELAEGEASTPLGLILRARAASLRGDFEAAGRDLDRAVTMEPELLAARVARYEHHDRVKAQGGGMGDMLTLFKWGEESPAVYRVLARRIWLGGRAEMAVTMLDLALKEAARERAAVATWLLRARLRLRLGDLSGASGDIDEALRRAPAAPEAQATRAELLVFRGQMTEALDLCEALPVGAPRERVRALAFERLERWPEAVEAAEAALATEPDDIWRLIALARLRLLRPGAGDEDRAAAERLLSIAPHSRDLRLALTLLDLRARRWDAALRGLDGILTVDPTDAVVRLKRAQLNKRLGELEAAVADLQELCKRSRAHPAGQAAAKMLEELGRPIPPPLPKKRN